MKIAPAHSRAVSARPEIPREQALAYSPSSAAAAPPVPATLTPPAGAPFFGMVTWLMNESARWKKADDYTVTIGQDLGIVGAAPVAHSDPPVFTADVMGNNNVQLGVHPFRA